MKVKKGKERKTIGGPMGSDLPAQEAVMKAYDAAEHSQGR